MKRLAILRLLTLSVMMFSTGLLTGWWLHQHLPLSVAKSQSAISATERLPDSQIPSFGITAKTVFDTESFERTLGQLQLDDALVIYQEQEKLNADHYQQLRTVLLQTVEQWQTAKEYKKASAALERFIQHYYQDQDLLRELSTIYIQQDDLLQAIETLISARSYAPEPDAVNSLTQDIHNHSKKLLEQKKKTQQLNEIIPLFQKLALLESDYGFYRYSLAESYLFLGDVQAAIRELEMLQTDVDYGRKASQMLADILPAPEIEPALPPSGAVPIYTRGNHFIVNASLKDRTNVQLMIDTGASLTTLPDEVLKSLKMKKMAYRVDHTQLKTAGGFVFAPIYLVKELRIGRFLLKNIKVAGLNANLQNSDGLLGMNVLGQFRFQIDQDNRQLLLQPR